MKNTKRNQFLFISDPSKKKIYQNTVPTEKENYGKKKVSPNLKNKKNHPSYGYVIVADLFSETDPVPRDPGESAEKPDTIAVQDVVRT